jgi:hypothetical protein
MGQTLFNLWRGDDEAFSNLCPVMKFGCVVEKMSLQAMDVVEEVVCVILSCGK